MKRAAVLLGICCVFGVILADMLLYRYQAAYKQKATAQQLNEYIRWENQMMDEHPDYDNMKILVDIREKKLYLLNHNEIIKQYSIASGREGHPSPLGSWTITNKAKWGGGFGTRWIGINVPWGTYGIHGTNKPHSIGQNASAGCIRMYNRDVEDLYQYVKQGNPVVIINGSMGPFGYGLQEIRPGDFGADVLEVQRRLSALGYYQASHFDGKYGPQMENALYQFQQDRGLPKNPVITLETLHALGIVLME